MPITQGNAGIAESQDRIPFDILDFIRRQQLESIFSGANPQSAPMSAMPQAQAPPTSQPTFTPPPSLGAYRQTLEAQPKIEDFKPSRLRSILGTFSGVGRGLATGNPQEAAQARQSVEYAPYTRAMGEYQSKLARSKSLYDLDADIEKTRLESGLSTAKTSAERAREASELAQKAESERRTAGMPGSFKEDQAAKIELAKIAHPEPKDEYLMNVDATGRVVAMKKGSGDARVEIEGTPEVSKATDTTDRKDYLSARKDFEASSPGKPFPKYLDNYPAFLEWSANLHKATANQISIGDMTNQQASKFQQVVAAYRASPAIRASDRTGVLDGAVARVRKDPQNGAVQYSLLYPFTQILDYYLSSVREGELNAIRDVASYNEQLKNYLQRINSNQVVSSETILQIADAALGIIADVKQGAVRDSASFKSQAEVLGLGPNWDKFIGGFQQSYSPAPAAPNPTASPEKIVFDYDATGNIVRVK